MTKQFEELMADSPLRIAASSILEDWLTTLAKHAQAILEGSDDPVEEVHQLRTFSRRLGAALFAFEKELPSRADKLARRLKKLRRAAGGARNLDVLLDDLQQRQSDRSLGEAMSPIIGAARAERQKANDRLRKTLEKWRRKDRFSQSIEISRDIDADDSETLGDRAKRMLPVAWGRVESAHAKVRPDDLLALHETRIQMKRFRYLMDMFTGCFVGEFHTDLYPITRQALDILGKLNDCRTFLEWLDQIEAEGVLAPGVRELRRAYRAGLEDWRRQFEDCWRMRLFGFRPRLESALLHMTKSLL